MRFRRRALSWHLARVPHDPRSRLARQAAAARKREAEARLEAEAIERMMRQIDAMDAAREQYEEGRGLRDVSADDTVDLMNVDTRGKPESVKRGAARATRRHKAQRKLYEAGVSLTDLARELGEGRPRVSSWFATGDDCRPIPQRHADYLLSKYGIPLSYWRRIGN